MCRMEFGTSVQQPQPFGYEFGVEPAHPGDVGRTAAWMLATRPSS